VLIAIRNEPATQDRTKHITVPLQTFSENNLEDFISAKSMTMFELMELPIAFLSVDPELWDSQEDYQQAAETVPAMWSLSFKNSVAL